jgi:hypothetical protein
MSNWTAAEILDLALAKPELLIHPGDLPATAEALRDLFAASGRFFDRGVPVRIIRSADDWSPAAIPLTRHNVVIEAHRLCRPMRMKADGSRMEVTLPDRVAQMYLDMVGDWGLSPLNGVTTAPILSADGSMRTAEGYDPSTGLLCSCVPKFRVPDRPSRADADAALTLLRQTFRTFPFADAPRHWDASIGAEVVDIKSPPGKDESGFLVALLTAVCRASLWLAPGFLVMAPAVSGAGTGKGLLVRAICMIAFSMQPRAFTKGGDSQELDKRLAAELIEARPSLFLDNANGVALRSDLLASILTERPARVRLLGQTRMAALNSSAFVTITGNGLSMSEDLARRFVASELNANCEDPELRSLPAGFLNQIEDQRAELLAVALTIWRWGRQNISALRRGKPLGSFEAWSDWCRDPLLTLGCRDPVERMEMLKANDPARQRLAELFRVWWEHHKSDPVKANQLAEPVRLNIDPQGRGRQYVATYLSRLAGTHAAGFVLNRQEPAGKWTAVTYVLSVTTASGAAGHRTDRTDQPSTVAEDPISPMGPMPVKPETDAVPPGAEIEI